MPGSSGSVGSIALDLGLDSSKFNKQTKALESSTKKAFTGMTSFLSNFLANMASSLLNKLLANIGNFVKDAINLSSDLQEVENVVDTVFSNMESQVDSFSQNAMKSFGLSELVAKQYMGQLGAMATAFGYTEEEAYNLSRSITGLVGDVSSFYNMSTDESFTKLKAIFTGETESLKSLGIVMTQSALDSFALANGFGKTTNEMSESEKVALRYKFVMAQLSKAQGDFSKTSGGWANQTRVLGLQFDVLKTKLGDGFIALLTPLVQWLNTVIVKMQSVASNFTAMVKTMMGVAESTVEVKDGTSVAADASAVLADNTEEVKKSAEAAKNAILGFDEINKLGDNSSTSEAKGDIGTFDWNDALLDGSAEAKAGNALDSIERKYTAWLRKLPKLKFNLDTEYVLKNIKQGFKNIWSAVSEFTNFVISIGIEVVNDIQLDRLIEKLSKLWERSTNLSATIVKTITPALKRFYEKGLSPIVKWIGEKLIDAVKLATEIFDDWAKWFDANASKIEEFGKMVGEVVGFFWSLLEPISDAAWAVATSIIQLLSETLQTLFNFILDHQAAVKVALYTVGAAWTAWKIASIVETVGVFLIQLPVLIAKLATLATTTWANVTAKIADKAETLALIGLYAKDFIVSIAGIIAKKAKELAAWVAGTAAKIADVAALVAVKVAQVAYTVATTAATAATWLFNAALAVLTSPITLIIAAIAALIAIVVLLVQHWDKVKEAATRVWDGIKKVWSSVASWFKDHIVDPIMDMFKKVGDFITTIFKGAVNGVIKAINGFIGVLNKLHIKLPDWDILGSYAGRTFGFNIKTLPMLAEGGFVKANQPTLAVIGDNKKEGEIVAPESKIAEAVSIGVAKALSMVQHLFTDRPTNQQPIEVVVQVGDEVLIDKVISGINNENRRAGRFVIKV